MKAEQGNASVSHMMHLNQSAEAYTSQSALVFRFESFTFVFNHIYVRFSTLARSFAANFVTLVETNKR